MKKVFLGIGLILISGIVSAQGLNEGMEKVLFPSWWGADTIQTEIDGATKTMKEELKDLEDELPGFEKELTNKNTELGVSIGERLRLGLPSVPDEDSIDSMDIEYFTIEDEIKKIDEKIWNKNKEIGDKEKEISATIDALRVAEKNVQPAGVIGYAGDQKFGLQYIPRIIDILLKFVAPIVMIMFIFSGIRLIYASGNDEDLEKSKTFFMYALLGVIFIVVSYSLMKALYFFLAT